jgi:hypothetical protein
MQGHIHKRVRTDRYGKETVRWYVVIDRGFDHEGRRRQKWHGGFRTRREAEAVRAKLVTDVNTGSYVTPGRTTLGDWIVDSWLPTTEPRVKPSTFFSYKRNLEIHVLPALGSRLLQQLTPSMLNVLYANLAAGSETRRPLSAKTIATSTRRFTRCWPTPSMPGCSAGTWPLAQSPRGRRSERPAALRRGSLTSSRRSSRS